MSPADGALHYTIGTWSIQAMIALQTRTKTVVDDLTQKHHLGYLFKWFEHFLANPNDTTCNHYVKRAAGGNGFHVEQRPYLFKFGEDFGWFAKHYPTAIFGQGSGLDTPALHNANYDFPDEIIETGMKMFQSIMTQILE